MDDRELAEYIRERRKSLHLTIEALAQEMDVNKTTIWRWESGDVKSIKKKDIIKLAECLNLPPELLLGLQTDAIIEASDVIVERNNLKNRIARLTTLKDIRLVELFIDTFIKTHEL